jgi:hypothetical protein
MDASVQWGYSLLRPRSLLMEAHVNTAPPRGHAGSANAAIIIVIVDLLCALCMETTTSMGFWYFRWRKQKSQFAIVVCSGIERSSIKTRFNIVLCLDG